MGVTGLIDMTFPDLGREVVDAYRESTHHRYQSAFPGGSLEEP